MARKLVKKKFRRACGLGGERQLKRKEMKKRKNARRDRRTEVVIREKIGKSV